MGDVEASNRSLIRSALQGHFDTWEEVPVRTVLGQVRIDVLARRNGGEFEGVLLAFEVKSGDKALNFQNWAKAFKQAADYVNGLVELPDLPERSVAAAFVFPSPPYVPFPSPVCPVDEMPWFRREQLAQYAGVIHLAEHFRVGWAEHSQDMGISLKMGPNPIWDARHDWWKSGRDLILSRRVGSQVKGRRTHVDNS